MAALVLPACRGQLIATAALHGAGSAEAQFSAPNQPLVLWADTDGTWHGGTKSPFPARYEVKVLVNGAPIGHVSRDTSGSNVRVCGTRVGGGSVQSGDCEFKLTCALPKLSAGEVVLRVQGVLGENAMEVKKMSVNVRND